MKADLNLIQLKKMGFKANSNGVAETPVEQPVAGESKETMNALHLQGVNNAYGNPALIKNVNVEAKDVDTKDYVVPFKSNIAFGKTSSALKALLFAAALSVGAGTMTSCDVKQENFQYVEKQDNSEIIALLGQLLELSATNIEIQRQIQLIMSRNGDNVEQSLKEIKEYLASIDRNVTGFRDDYNKAQEETRNASEKLYNLILEAREDMNNNSEVTQKLISAQTQVIVNGYKAQVEQLNKFENAIITAIANQTITLESSLDNVASTIGMAKDDMISFLKKLGYTQAQISKMNAQQIMNAINNQTAVISDKIEKFMGLMNKIDKADAARFEFLMGVLDEVIRAGGNFSDELLSKIDQAIEILTNIDNTTQEISKDLKEALAQFTEFKAEYEANEATRDSQMKQLIKNGHVQTSIMSQILNVQKEQNKNIKNLETTVNNLKNAIHNDINSVKEAIKNGDSNVINAIKALGIDVTAALSMSQDELIAAVQGFENTYIQTEAGKQAKWDELLDKLDNLQFSFPGVDLSGIEAILKGATDGIGEKLDGLGDKLNTIIDGINTVIKNQETIINKMDTQSKTLFNKIDGLADNVDAIKGDVAGTKAAVDGIADDMKDIKDLLGKLQKAMDDFEGCTCSGGSGSGVTLDELKPYLEKYGLSLGNIESLLKQYGIDFNDKLDTVISLEKKIDDDLNKKADAIKDAIDGLKAEMGKLNPNSPDYSDQLNAIETAIKNLKFICDCNSNEGII